MFLNAANRKIVAQHIFRNNCNNDCSLKNLHLTRFAYTYGLPKQKQQQKHYLNKVKLFSRKSEK